LRRKSNGLELDVLVSVWRLSQIVARYAVGSEPCQGRFPAQLLPTELRSECALLARIFLGEAGRDEKIMGGNVPTSGARISVSVSQHGLGRSCQPIDLGGLPACFIHKARAGQ
jgi:hypothetical protein